MKAPFKISILSIPIILAMVLPSEAADYHEQALKQAHTLFRSATNAVMYAEAAQQYEYLAHEEKIRNGSLFYTLGNCWFMAEDIGRAVLNYRRAERFIPNDADLQHNLSVALAARTDLIPGKKPHALVSKLLGWHLYTTTALRWWGFTSCWILFWTALLWCTRTAGKTAKIAGSVTGLLSAVLLLSLVTEWILQSRKENGVIIATEVIARKGDSSRYGPAFQEPLHAGTEFRIIGKRGDWQQIRLPDGQTCWIPISAAEPVDLSE